MTSRFLVSSAALMLSLAACSTAGPALRVTPVIATAEEQRSFAGVWRGHVDSADARFAGQVEFRFEPGGAVIIPPQSAPARILWVRITPSGVSGALEPYFDVARGADVYTTFDATLHGTTLSGVLRERVGMRWTEAATWSVRRIDDPDETPRRPVWN